MASAWPRVTWSPARTAISDTTPSNGATTTCSIFIASSVTTGSLFSFYLSRPLNILLMLVCAGVLLSSIRPIIMDRRAEKLALASRTCSVSMANLTCDYMRSF